MESLNNIERFYLWRYEQAQQLYEDEKYEECYTICNELLLIPELPQLLEAGAHLFLGTSDTNEIFHATKAVELFERMLAEEPDNGVVTKMLADAPRTLAVARVDEAVEEDPQSATDSTTQETNRATIQNARAAIWAAWNAGDGDNSNVNTGDHTDTGPIENTGLYVSSTGDW